MRRVLMFAVILLVTIVMFGCSDTPQITNPSTPADLGTLVQRPEFIDTRPEAVISTVTLKPTVDYIVA